MKKKTSTSNPKGSPVGPPSEEIDFGMRPGGMLVQMRDDGDSGGASSRGPVIKINVSHGPAHYELFVSAHSTFGDIKKAHDYAKVGIPMMPVVAGEKATRHQILIYAVLLLPLSVLPWWIGGTGAIYGISALVLSSLFLALSIRVGLRERSGEDDAMKPEKQLFAYSVLYLFALFAVLVVDRFIVL